MENIEAKKSLVERLRICPKLQCYFWSRRNNCDGTMSEITYEDEDFWKQERSSLLLLAARRFENNLHERKTSPDAVTTELYDSDRLVAPQWPDDESSAATNSQLLRSLDWMSFEEMKPNQNLSSSYVNFNLNQTPNSEQQNHDRIPHLGPVNDQDESFSSASSGMLSVLQKDSICETDEMEDLFKKIVNTSTLSTSLNTLSTSLNTPANTVAYDRRSTENDAPFRRKPSQLEAPSPEFIDVKKATCLNLFVDDYPETGFLSLLESLQSNQVIERIVIFRKRTTNGERRTRSLEDMDNLFYVINSLSKSLVELVLWNFHPEDLSSLHVGLLDQPSIGYLELHMELGTIDQDLVETIACNMPSLVSIELEVHGSFPVWVLLESDSLAVLEVISTGFEFESNDVLRLASKVRTNYSLTVLDLGPLIPRWCLGTVMASVRFSHCTKLETFRFSCRNHNHDQGDACMAEVLKTIESKTAPLRIVWNHSNVHFSVSDETRSRAMQAFTRNPSLEQFRVFQES